MGSIRLRTFTRRIGESRNRHKNHFTGESTSRFKRERESPDAERWSQKAFTWKERVLVLTDQQSEVPSLSPPRDLQVSQLLASSPKAPTCSLKKLFWLEWHSYIYLWRHFSLFPLASFSHQSSHRVHTGFHTLEGSKVTLEFPLPSFHSFFAVSNFP